MKILENIKSFLYDKEYFINIFDNYVYVFNYLDLINFSETAIQLQMENFKVAVEGENLSIVKMMEKEILIEGTIKKVVKKRSI